MLLYNINMFIQHDIYFIFDRVSIEIYKNKNDQELVPIIYVLEQNKKKYHISCI